MKLVVLVTVSWMFFLELTVKSIAMSARVVNELVFIVIKPSVVRLTIRTSIALGTDVNVG